MLRFSPKHCPKIYLLCDRRHNSAPKSVGFQMDRTLPWESYCIIARFAVLCTLLLKHLVLATVGHRTLEEHGPWIAPTTLFQ